MSRLKLYLISILCLLVTIPWIFNKESSDRILGFPNWAFYTILTTIIYGIVIAFLLQKYWRLSAGEELKNKKRYQKTIL